MSVQFLTHAVGSSLGGRSLQKTLHFLSTSHLRSNQHFTSSPVVPSTVSYSHKYTTASAYGTTHKRALSTGCTPYHVSSPLALTNQSQRSVAILPVSANQSQWPKRNRPALTSQAQRSRSTIAYVVLPEVPKDTAETNTALDWGAREPSWETISKSSLLRAAGKAAIEHEVAGGCHIEELENKGPGSATFESVLAPMERTYLPLSYTASLLSFLFTVNSEAFPPNELTRGVTHCERARQERWMAHNFVLYRDVVELLKEADSSGDGGVPLTQAQRRLAEIYVAEGKLMGVSLTDPKERRDYTFHARWLDERMEAFTFYATATAEMYRGFIRDPSHLEEMPAEKSDRMRVGTGQSGPWRVTLDQPTYSDVMTYCSHRPTRLAAWRASRNCASMEWEEMKLCNNKVIDELVDRRYDLAVVLGYHSYADMVHSRGMAGSTENVVNFIENMKNAFHSDAQEELASLEKFAASVEGVPSFGLELWDIDYYGRLQKQDKYGLTGDSLKDWFPYERVRDCMFEECQALFGIKIEASNEEAVDVAGSTKRWHTSLERYAVTDIETGETMGYFCLDPYARPGKDSSGMPMPLRERSLAHGTLPVSAIMMDLTAPAILGESNRLKPSLLSATDLRAFFSQFGQMLSHILCTAPYAELHPVSVPSSVFDTDAISVPGRVLSSLLFEPEFLRRCARHWQTGEEGLKESVAETFVAADTHLHALHLMETLYLSAYDVEMHISKPPSWFNTSARLWREYMLFPLHDDDFHQMSLVQVFGSRHGCCNVYSKLWAEMVALDIVAEFEGKGGDGEQNGDVIAADGGNKGNVMATAGRWWREAYLSPGSGASAAEAFHKFKGQSPSMESYFRKYSKSR